METKLLIPNAIVFLIPTYWESILQFIEQLKNEKSLSDIPIIYIGQFIEGAEMAVLQKYRVKTMTMGPVPVEEMVRFVITQIPLF